MKILIIGDSFAADWSVKYTDYPGWPELLAHEHDVTNLAQAGISEYRILQQLESVADLAQFDLVIVSHTSPYRVHTRRHPVHHRDPLHLSADLILSDIEYHAGRIQNWLNPGLKSALGFFHYHFDEKYYETVYTMFRERINQRLAGKQVIVINNLPDNLKFATEPVVLDFSADWKENRGLINHFSEVGNRLIHKQINNIIKQHIL